MTAVDEEHRRPGNPLRILGRGGGGRQPPSRGPIPGGHLAEQRWRYPATAGRTPAALRDWITETGISRYVLVGPRDTRLHLDTHHRAHLDLLLDEIAAGNRWLFRAPTPDQMGVVGDVGAAMHPAEAVFTVAAPTPAR